MASLLKKTETPTVGQVQEEPVLAPELANGEASIGAEQPHFKTPVQESTPHDDMVALTVAVKQSPAPKPDGDDECPDRTAHEGEPPIHEHSEGQLPKFSVQESGQGADQEMSHWVTGVPSTKSYTKCKDSYESEVMKKCLTKFKEFPKALGLIVLFACPVAAPSRKLPPVPGVVKGVDMMIKTFRYLGYAVLRLPEDLASWQYRAAMKAVASVYFPESYRHIFVYFTGHGGDDFIDTRDGNLKLEDITKPFSPKQAPHLELSTKIFIFDTCRGLSKLHSIFPNSVLLFPTHPGYPAFAKTDDDCGLLTQHLAPALRTSSKSFGDIVIDVTNAITTEVKNDPRLSKQVPAESRPLLCQTLKAHVCLVKERMDAMTPSIIIQKIGPTSISVAISSPPSSAQFHPQHLRLFYKCEGTEQWVQVDRFDNVRGGTVVIDNLLHGKRYTVKAEAVYPDDEEISSQEIPCDMPTEVEPVLNQVRDYCHVDSVEFEVCQPAKRDELEWFEVVCQCEETQEPKPLEWPENDRVRISELEPGVQYTVKATARYPNEPTVSVTKSFEIPKHDVTPKIEHSESQQPTCRSVTVSVTAPPQADKYHPESLSAKLWRKKDKELWQANEGELQSQTIPVDQRGETATFRKLSPSTTYVAKAIATYPNKVVSSDPVTIPSRVPYRIILFCIFLFLGFSLSLTFFILYQQDHVPAVTKLGLERDTIVASHFHSFGSTSVNITECPEAGDDPHTLKAALVTKIIIYTENYTGTINSSAAGRVSLLEDEYFLQGSSMAVNICLSSPLQISTSTPVFAFVFDSSDDNQKFLHNETDGIQSSLYNKVLQVGTTSKPICTWVNYSVASPAYYYLALGEYALGTLAYSADLYLHEKYLNFSDYEGSEQYCSSVSEMPPCRLELHKRVERKEYFLVTYIRSRPSSFSPSTHVCAKFHQSVVVVIVLSLLTVLLFLILALVITFNLYRCVKKHGIVQRCHGYKPPDNVV